LYPVIIMMALGTSCATIPDPEVNYRLPATSQDLNGMEILLKVEDARASKETLGKGARNAFKQFSGNMSFSLARGSEPGIRMGLYDVPSLMKEAFQRRLENMGARVVSVVREGGHELLIVLKHFMLDLEGRTWTFSMAYEARLRKEEIDLVKQMVSGEAERFRLAGRAQADALLGELFTDMVNRLDMVKLIDDADL
jgi:hypothetical protein